MALLTRVDDAKKLDGARKRVAEGGGGKRGRIILDLGGDSEEWREGKRGDEEGRVEETTEVVHFSLALLDK